MTTHRPVPPVWFRLPPGFHDIGPGDRGALEEVAGALGALSGFGPGPDGGLGDGLDAGSQLARLMDCLDELAAQPGLQLLHSAIGLHPEGPEAVSASVFSLAARPAGDVGSGAGVERTALALARSAPVGDGARRFLDLASGLPCALVSGGLPGPGTGPELFQARAVTAHPDGHHLLLLDLTSTATAHAGAYTSILEAVVHTIAFADPRPRPPGGRGDGGRGGSSRILELLE
ncbi:hypothetical protein [Streptomyces sp. TBY4]|uniref:hypothetical protein n=1 Tax=Streptomyces sp. TBY4 TaxID=2962030 RepID=UPI0020B6BEB6|nr:hypothetical protein [Streptomyces sp. TBY4]MCP3753860.1 hypothetical protein [Streptomyces sp. TBY4]